MISGAPEKSGDPAPFEAPVGLTSENCNHIWNPAIMS